MTGLVSVAITVITSDEESDFKVVKDAGFPYIVTGDNNGIYAHIKPSGRVISANGSIQMADYIALFDALDDDSIIISTMRKGEVKP